MAEKEPPKKIVLAYSGGLDTSVILPWLKERYPGVKLVAYAAELGQGDELKGIEAKAYKSGADEVVIEDLRAEFAEKYCFPLLRAHAIYEQDYLLGTSIARPLIAAKQPFFLGTMEYEHGVSWVVPPVEPVDGTKKAKDDKDRAPEAPSLRRRPND